MDAAQSLFQLEPTRSRRLRSRLVRIFHLYFVLEQFQKVYFCSSADDSVTGQKVAIKKLAKPFATNIHAKRAYREIKLLKHVNHDNIIRLYDLFTKAKSPEELDDM